MSKKIDPDILALKQAKKALLKSTSKRMLKANLDYLMDYFVIHPSQEISLPNTACTGRVAGVRSNKSKSVDVCPSCGAEGKLRIDPGADDFPVCENCGTRR